MKELIHNIYKRYIPDFPAEDMVGDSFPLTAESPFGGGDLIIKENGEFEQPSSGKIGTAADFLREVFPLLTQEGAQQAMKAEGELIDCISNKIVAGRQQDFKKNTGLQQSFLELTGVDTKHILQKDILLDPSLNALQYISKSNTGFPIHCQIFKPGIRGESLVGVPRIHEHPGEKRIWFTENPLQKVLLESVMDEPVYTRPTEEQCGWNDYNTLVEGKQVICLMDDDYGDWSDSFHPFMRSINQTDIDLRAINVNSFTKGEGFEKWLVRTGNQKESLLEAVDKVQSKQVKMYDRETYHRYIQKTGSQRLDFPQDVVNGRLTYGTVDGFIVLSNPVNCITPESLLKNYHLDTTPTPNEAYRLSKEEILNIDSSFHLYTPQRTFTTLKELIEEYIYFENPQTYTLLTLWILGGYLYKVFQQYPYLHLNGGADTGKSTSLDIIAACGFNGQLESQTTRAQLINQVHSTGGTMCLDEFESSALGTGDAYSQMLKGGYDSNGSYSKSTGKGSPTRFNTYSPKALAGIDPIGDEALETRTIPIKTIVKPSSVRLSVWDENLAKSQRMIKDIRRGGYVLGLFHHRSIQKEYRKVEVQIQLPSGRNLDNRRRQIISPLLAVARVLDINQKVSIEEELLEAVDIAWNPDYKSQTKRLKLLEKQLQEWSGDPAFTSWAHKDGKLWIDNKHWIGTDLCNELGSKDSVLKWFKKLSGVQKEAKHLENIKATDKTRSSTGFPVDLKIHKKTVAEIFSGKTGF